MKGIEPRSERMEIRLTPTQKSILKKQAKLSGMSIADYIISCVKKDINQYRGPGEYINLQEM